MSLKILFIPLSFIVVLILLIGYMKPGYDIFLTKQTAYRAAQKQLDQMNVRLVNITSVVNDFSTRVPDGSDGKNEQEVFIDQYVPEVLDQSRVVDAFNYLAGQSGVLISSIAIEQPVVKKAEDPSQDQAMSSQALILNGAGTATQGMMAESDVFLKAVYPRPSMYQATLEITSEYAAVSHFFNLIYRMNRENEIQSFSLKKDVEKKDSAGNPVESSALKGSLVVSFMYYPGLTDTSIQNIEALPIFSAGKIDTETFDYLREKTESRSLPELVSGDVVARANPFAQ